MKYNKLLYSVKETSEILNISSTKTYELIQQNKLPNIRLGKRVLIPKNSLENWLIVSSIKTQSKNINCKVGF